MNESGEGTYKKKICVTCGSTSNIKAKFCSHCGTKLPDIHCPQCGKEIVMIAYYLTPNYCEECGFHLNQPRKKHPFTDIAIIKSGLITNIVELFT